MKNSRTTTIRAAFTNTALAALALGTRPYYQHQLDTAARTAHAVRIGYTKENGEHSERLITPTAKVEQSKAGDYYVRAWDALRDAKRSFRIDRITTLETA
ncbi:WYL domain-containing protein [Streptomyces sp. NPDC055105]|uniref:WYL domain-containing protein n=1 Tax=Streptomyces sp. NPDC055105 TaxID=3365719 RepID=UPI0037CD25A5